MSRVLQARVVGYLMYDMVCTVPNLVRFISVFCKFIPRQVTQPMSEDDYLLVEKDS